MDKVVVHPERCVGCMQCMTACATAHSRSQNLISAVMEIPQPRPRIHVGAGLHEEGFPNRCRHCNPAPCQLACLPGAIFREAETDTVLIDPDLCINCASCAMACPFGVIRYHADHVAPPGKIVAVKCDNCIQRQQENQIPACVEACKVAALTFEAPDKAMQRKTAEVARTVSAGAESPPLCPPLALLHSMRKAQLGLRQA